MEQNILLIYIWQDGKYIRGLPAQTKPGISISNQLVATKEFNVHVDTCCSQ